MRWDLHFFSGRVINWFNSLENSTVCATSVNRYRHNIKSNAKSCWTSTCGLLQRCWRSVRCVCVMKYFATYVYGPMFLVVWSGRCSWLYHSRQPPSRFCRRRCVKTAHRRKWKGYRLPFEIYWTRPDSERKWRHARTFSHRFFKFRRKKMITRPQTNQTFSNLTCS